MRSSNMIWDSNVALGTAQRYTHCGQDWGLVFDNSFYELKTARTLKDTQVWRELSNAVKIKGVEGTASTMELTLFFSFVRLEDTTWWYGSCI
jgi:hypothetical protein